MFKKYFRSSKKSARPENYGQTRRRSTSDTRRSKWKKSPKHSRSTTVPSESDMKVGCFKNSSVVGVEPSVSELLFNRLSGEEDLKIENIKYKSDPPPATAQPIEVNTARSRDGFRDNVEKLTSQVKISLATTDEDTSTKLSNTTPSRSEDLLSYKLRQGQKVGEGGDYKTMNIYNFQAEQVPKSFGVGAKKLLNTLETLKVNESSILSTHAWSEVRSLLNKGLEEIEILRARLQEAEAREEKESATEVKAEPGLKLSFCQESNSGTVRSDLSLTNDTTVNIKQNKTSEQLVSTDEESGDTIVENNEDHGVVNDAEDSFGQVESDQTELVIEDEEVKDGELLDDSDENEVGNMWGFNEKDQSRVESDDEGEDDLDNYCDDKLSSQLRIEELEEQLRETQAILAERTAKHEQELIDKDSESRRTLIKVKRKQLQALATLRDELTESHAEVHAKVYEENVSLHRELAARKVREEELQEQIQKLDADYSMEVEEALRLTTELQETRRKLKKIANQQKVVVRDRDKKLEKEVRELRISRRDLVRRLNEKADKEKEQLRKTQEYSLECERLEDAVSDLRQQLAVWRTRRTSVPEAMIRRATLDTDTSRSHSESRKRRCKTATENIMLPLFIKKLDQQDELTGMGDFVWNRAQPESPVKKKSSDSLYQRANSQNSLSLLVNSDHFSSTDEKANFEGVAEPSNDSQRKLVYLKYPDGNSEGKSNEHENNQVSPDHILNSCELSSREQSTEAATVDEHSNSPSVISNNVDSKEEMFDERNFNSGSLYEVVPGRKEDNKADYRVKKFIPLVI